VVFDVDRQRFDPLFYGQVLGHRPGDQHRRAAVEHLEPQVEVQPAGVVLMDDEAVARRGVARVDVAGHLGRRFGRLLEAALGGVVARFTHALSVAAVC
jgi:hypothetical protein